MFKLRGFLKGYQKQVILGPAFKLLEAIFELIVPLVMAKIIDVGVAQKDISYVLKMGGVMILLGVLGLVFALICQYSAAVASQGFGTALRSALYAHINTFSHAELDQFSTASLVTRVTNDINQMQLAVAMLIRLVVRAPFLAIGSIVMAMLIDWKLSLIFLIATPLIALTIFWITNRSVPYFKRIQKKLDLVGKITRENLDGARVIRAFSRQQQEEDRFCQANDSLAQTSVRVGRISALLNPLTFLIMNFAIVAIVWFGGERVYEGSLSQGQIIALVNYMTQTLLAVIVVANLVVLFTKASASAARINEVFETKPSLRATQEDTGAGEGEEKNPPPRTPSTYGKPAANPAAFGQRTPKIEFQNVTFAYSKTGQPALENISLSIASGETLGIIGGTGSGKTTLISLIPRFYDVQRGAVLVDGKDVRTYPFDTLRKKIGLVPQGAALFSGSLRSNIQWGLPNADDDQIRRALDIAQATEFVDKLPDGYDTILAQGGKNLSGGQRQRLTIARALVRDPEILILDDSASALDYRTDARLRAALASGTREMTVLIVSQRASAILHADRILVLDDGRVAGVGTHEQLRASCEVYREILKSQQLLEDVSGA